MQGDQEFDEFRENLIKQLAISLGLPEDLVTCDLDILSVKYYSMCMKSAYDTGYEAGFKDGIAEILHERELHKQYIRSKQLEGINKAIANGVKFGRKPKPKPDNFEEVRDLWLKGEISQREAAKRLGVNHRTFKNWI